MELGGFSVAMESGVFRYEKSILARKLQTAAKSGTDHLQSPEPGPTLHGDALFNKGGYMLDLSYCIIFALAHVDLMQKLSDYAYKIDITPFSLVCTYGDVRNHKGHEVCD